MKYKNKNGFFFLLIVCLNVFHHHPCISWHHKSHRSIPFHMVPSSPYSRRKRCMWEATQLWDMGVAGDVAPVSAAAPRPLGYLQLMGQLRSLLPNHCQHSTKLFFRKTNRNQSNFSHQHISFNCSVSRKDNRLTIFKLEHQYLYIKLAKWNIFLMQYRVSTKFLCME